MQMQRVQGPAETSGGGVARDGTEVRIGSFSGVARGVAAAQDLGAKLYYPHHLRVLSGADVDLVARVSVADHFTIGTLEYSAPIRVDTEAYENAYQVNLALDEPVLTSAGAARMRMTKTHAAAYRPDVPTAFSGWSTSGRMLAVKMARDGLESAVEAYLGKTLDGPLDLEFGLRVGEGAGRSWLAAVRRLAWVAGHVDAAGARRAAQAVGAEEAETSGFVRRLVEEAELSLVRAACPGLGQRLREVVPAPDGPVRRAVELMECLPTAAMSLGELAEYTGVSGRALQLGFQRDLDTTPLKHLKACRLDRARAAILAGAAGRGDRLPVAEIAARYGFTHLGRFAAEYKRRFGVLPSQDAGRSAAPPPGPGGEPDGR